MFSTKDTRNHKEHKRIGLIRDRKEWGAAPRPGRGRALSHPRERRTENGAPLQGDGWGRVKTELPDL